MAPPVSTGQLVAEKYIVERVIGEGGMGIVVAARHIELDQRVAIKFLLPEIAQHATAAQRFRREARAAARMRGEHVCRVLDVGTLSGSGIPYMVMEYLEGCDLASELLYRKRLSVEEATEYVLQACEALAEAHTAGIVHRDLKPSNLFLASQADGTRTVKVLDFGVSKLMIEGGAQLALTSTATLIGSPLYMSPEQLDSAKDVDARTDIWALSAVLFELLTGRTPFLADSIAQLTIAVLNGQPPPLADLGIPVPAGLEAVMLRALSKDRAQRPATVAEFARALAPFAPAHAATFAARASRLQPGVGGPTPTGTHASIAGSLSAEPKRPGAQDSLGTPHTPNAWERLGLTQLKKKRVTWLVATLVLAAAVVLLYALRSRPEEGPHPVATPQPKPADVAATSPGLPSHGAPPSASVGTGGAAGGAALGTTALDKPSDLTVNPVPVVQPGKGEAPGSPLEASIQRGAEMPPETPPATGAASPDPAAKRPATPAAKPPPRPRPTAPSAKPVTPPPDKTRPPAQPTGLSDFGGRR